MARRSSSTTSPPSPTTARACLDSVRPDPQRQRDRPRAFDQRAPDRDVHRSADRPDAADRGRRPGGLHRRGLQSDGTLNTAIGNVPVATYSRNGNLQIAQLYSGAAQPSTAAATATGALFYGNGLSVGAVSSDPQVLSNGNTNGRGDDHRTRRPASLVPSRRRPPGDGHRHRSAGSGNRLSVRLARLLRLEHQLLPGQRQRRSVHRRDQRPDPGGQRSPVAAQQSLYIGRTGWYRRQRGHRATSRSTRSTATRSS